MKEIWSLIRETFKDWGEDKAPRLAAALSYYTVFSLAPLLVLVLAITGFIIGNNESIRQQLLTQIQGMVGAKGADIVNTMITSTSQPRNGILATIIGIVTLIAGATGVFGQLQDALNTIWEVQPKPNRGILAMLKERFLSFTMVLGMCFLLLVSLVISTALAALNTYMSGMLGGAGILAQIVNFVVSIGVITLIFALIFRYLPDAEIDWADVWIGALVTAILFGIGRTVLGLYLGSAAASSAYGAAGSLVILLLWVYYSAQILFMGAEFTQVYARHRGKVIQPAKNAIAVTDAERANQGMGTSRRERPAERAPQPQVQGLIPVVGQPAIHANPTREVVRYEPPKPGVVVPVIAAGTAAGVFTVVRLVRKIIDAVM